MLYIWNVCCLLIGNNHHGLQAADTTIFLGLGKTVFLEFYHLYFLEFTSSLVKFLFGMFVTCSVATTAVASRCQAAGATKQNSSVLSGLQSRQGSKLGNQLSLVGDQESAQVQDPDGNRPNDQ